MTGSVKGSDGRPVADAAVSFKSSDGGRPVQGLALASELGKTFSKPDGSYRLEVVPGKLTITARSDAGRGEVVVGSVEAGQSQRVDIRLSAPLEVTGTVTGPDGRPAENAMVALHPRGGGIPSADYRRVRTDSSGTYRITDAFPGPMFIEAYLEAEGHAPPKRLTLVPGRKATQNLRIEPARSISGRLVRNGSPLAGYRVRAGRSGMRLKIESITDQDGRFELFGLGPGIYHIAVYRPNGKKAIVGEFETPASNLTLEVPE
jgi:protocatechuate 3,4-dioxygenase beta subunit